MGEILRRGRLLDRRTFVAGAAGLGMTTQLGRCSAVDEAATENAARLKAGAEMWSARNRPPTA